MRQLKPQRRDNSASRRGQQAVAEILTSARDVLVEEGYPRFTMRNVAKRAGITVGNLSYYYDSKEALLHDLLEAVIQGYTDDFKRIVENAANSPEERLEEFVRFVMGDLSTKETTGFFPALWALASHNAFAAREMAKIYQIERDALSTVIGDMRPTLTKQERDALALFISASIEGHTMFIGHEREKAAMAAEATNIAVYAFLSLVATIDRKAIKQLKIAVRTPARRAAS